MSILRNIRPFHCFVRCRSAVFHFLSHSQVIAPSVAYTLRADHELVLSSSPPQQNVLSTEGNRASAVKFSGGGHETHKMMSV